MARAINRLTAITVARAKKPGLLADGAGLYLRVGPTGAKSWIFRYRSNGKLHDMGLGALHTVSLADARERAQDCRQLRLLGGDPVEVRKAGRAEAALAAAASITFRECAERYIAAHKAGWRNLTHAEQWPTTLATYVYPVFGDLPVQAVDVGLVLKAIEPIWTEKPETAGRVRGRIESVLDWATARQYRRGENPARWRGHLDKLLPKKSKVHRVKHHPALPYTEIGAFMSELRQHQGIAARALEFLILTAARTGEVTGARWDEFDLAGHLWTMPGVRMKSGKEHRSPLSDAALVVIERMAETRQGDFVFPGGRAGKPLSKMAMREVLSRMSRTGLTIHGFRSTFRDWAAEQTNYPREIAEMALAHTVGAVVERSYQRSDLLEKRRQLAEAWSRFCAAAPVSGDAVPIRQSAAE